jgi:hypothetical protein
LLVLFLHSWSRSRSLNWNGCRRSIISTIRPVSSIFLGPLSTNFLVFCCFYFSFCSCDRFIETFTGDLEFPQFDQMKLSDFKASTTLYWMLYKSNLKFLCFGFSDQTQLIQLVPSEIELTW